MLGWVEDVKLLSMAGQHFGWLSLENIVNCRMGKGLLTRATRCQQFCTGERYGVCERRGMEIGGRQGEPR